MVNLNQLSDMAESGFDSNATYHDGKWYVWGGVGTDESRDPPLIEYDPDTESSTVVDRLPFNPLNSQIYKPTPDASYAYSSPRNGGSTSTFALSDVLKLNPTTQSYTKVGSISTGLRNPQGIAKDGAFYFWGGNNSGTLETGFYKVENDSVTKVGDLSTGQDEAATGLAADGTVYAFGGNPDLDAVREVDVVAASTTKVASMDVSFKRTRGGMPGDGYMYVIPREDTQDVLQIDPSDGSTTVIGSTEVALRNTMTGVRGGNVWSFGGKTSDGSTVVADVYRLSAGIRSGFVYESGTAVFIETAGGHDYEFVSGKSLLDDGSSEYVFVSGNGVGR